jgi:hypothetical protein
MILRRLLDALHASDFGENFGEEAGFVQKFKRAAGAAFGEHPGEFVADALTADDFGFVGETADGGGCGGVDLKAEPRGKANGAQHAQVIFFKALAGLADGADDTGSEIGQAVDVVDQSCAESFSDGGRLFK